MYNNLAVSKRYSKYICISSPDEEEQKHFVEVQKFVDTLSVVGGTEVPAPGDAAVGGEEAFSSSFFRT